MINPSGCFVTLIVGGPRKQPAYFLLHKHNAHTYTAKVEATRDRSLAARERSPVVRSRIRDDWSIILVTEALGRCVLRSPHSPGPTLMSILFLDRQPSRVDVRLPTPLQRRLQRKVTSVGLDSLVASGYTVRSLRSYIRKRRPLATYLPPLRVVDAR